MDKNTLLKLLPFLGGVGGATVGAVGGPVGMMAAGGAGAGGGELLKQMLLGEKTDLKKASDEARSSILGSTLGLGAGKVLGGVGKAITQKLPEGLMSRVFKEPIKQTGAAIKSGSELGKEALKRGVKGSSEGIYNQALSKINNIEDALQSLLMNTEKKVPISKITEAVKPLVSKYKQAGNKGAADALTARIESIVAENGTEVPAAAANQIKRTLYDEARKAYGTEASAGMEGIKAIARGFKESLDDIPGVTQLNKDLSFYGRTADAMMDKLIKSGRSSMVGMTDAILGAGGFAAAGPVGIAPVAVNKFLQSTTGASNLANILNSAGKVGEKAAPAGNILMQMLGQGATKLPGVLASPGGDPNNNEQNNNEPHDNQSIPQNSKQALQDGQVSPGGQWKFDSKAGDWIPNQESQTASGGITKDKIGQAMLMDLLKTGGKNIGQLKTISEFIVPEEPKKKPLTAVQQTLATNVESATRALDKVETSIGKDPSLLVKSKLPGPLAGVAGASTYNTARKEVADVLARMRTGAVINDEELKLYLSKLPEIGDSKGDIKYKMDELRFIFSSLKDRLENQSGPDLQLSPEL